MLPDELSFCSAPLFACLARSFAASASALVLAELDETTLEIRSLHRRGVFAVRRAVPQVAARIGISRASAYTYLAEIREQGAP